MDEIVRLGSLQDDGGAVDLYNVARVYAFMVVGTCSCLAFLMVDVVAVGGCYKPEGQTITMEEIDTAKKAPLGLVSIPHWTNLLI